MKRGEYHYTSGCVPEAGTHGSTGCCLLCGYEWSEENCCGTDPCPCMAMAHEWRDISFKNIILFVTHRLAQPYSYFWQKWYS